LRAEPVLNFSGDFLEIFPNGTMQPPDSRRIFDKSLPGGDEASASGRMAVNFRFADFELDIAR
jgi:hypothetical protein